MGLGSFERKDFEVSYRFLDMKYSDRFKILIYECMILNLHFPHFTHCNVMQGKKAYIHVALP